MSHRLEAAEQAHAIAPGLVSEYIAQLTGLECNHAIRRRRTRDADCRPRADRDPVPTRSSTRARHEALEYLASALAAPSLAADPRVAGIVRGSTDQGKTVVSFLLHVIHGVVRGFRPRQRVQAASELLGHIARDELRADADQSSFPSSREPIPDSGPAEADLTVIPAESLPRTRYGAGIQGGGNGDGLPSSRERRQDTSPADTGPSEADPCITSIIPAESLPRTRYGAGIQGGGDEDGLPPFPSPLTGEGWGEGENDLEAPESHHGCYDIDRKIADAQRDPVHPIHKFVQAYDEVAAAFHGEDNDDDEEVRYWISGEVPDAYGKYIWEYAPAHPRSTRRRLRPRRRRSRSPGTAAKAESVWMKRPTDKMREAGIPRPNRFKIWV